MDLEEDIREFVLTNLPHDPRHTEELKRKTLPELLIFYVNWRSRLVPIAPRRVYRSRAINANRLVTDPLWRPGFDAIVLKLETGRDVTSHLSRGIRHGYAPPRSSGKGNRQDLDLLLNDWGVYHLHLSTTIEEDGFVERTGPLLFAVLKSDEAFLIDIVEHGGWTLDRVIEIMATDWPHHRLVWELKGIVPSGKRMTESDRKAIRNAHANSYFEINGKTYMPAGGLTGAGTSTLTTLTVQNLLRALKHFKERLYAEPDYLNKACARSGATLSANPDLRFQFFPEGGYGVVEMQTGFRFVLGP